MNGLPLTRPSPHAWQPIPALRRRLAVDLAEVSALGRGEVHVDLAAEVSALVAEVRAQADRLGFDSPIRAATLAKKHLNELPAAERTPGSGIAAYHRAASRTLREGRVTAHHTSPTGEQLLTFHRAAEEAAGTTVTLEAQVRTEPDGTVWLDSFGWPTTPVPVYTFTGGAYFDQAVTDLADDTVPFDRAMLMLLASVLDTAPSPPDNEQRIAAAQQIARRRQDLNGYLAQARNYAYAAFGREWFGACLYRSALEAVFENFLGSVAFSLVDMAEVDEVDRLLRELLPEAPATTAAVPAGIPEHHWWWQTALRN